MTTRPNVQLVTVNYGSSRLLERNLAELPDEIGVVVVDNYSDSIERRRILGLGAAQSWTVVTPALNLGFGDGVNLGVEKVLADGADVVLVINPDAVLTAAGAEALAISALSRPRAIVAPLTVNSGGSINFSGQEIDLEAGRTRRADVTSVDHPWLTGACLAFTPRAWELSGGFASDYFLYWEDVDLSWAMLKRGGELYLDENVTVVHDAGGTQESSRVSGKSPLYVYYNCRSRLVFAARNLSAKQSRNWAKGSARYAKEVLLRGGSRRVLISPPHIWAAIRGTVSGLKYLRQAGLPHN